VELGGSAVDLNEIAFEHFFQTRQNQLDDYVRRFMRHVLLDVVTRDELNRDDFITAMEHMFRMWRYDYQDHLKEEDAG
jgi:hypothetical protein